MQRRPSESCSYSLSRALPGAHQRLLHRGATHVEALADLAVGEPVDVAHHEHARLHVGQLVEGAAQMIEALLGDQRRLRQRAPGHAALIGPGKPGLGVHRDLHRARRAPMGVDCRVLGDPVDPGSKGEFAVGLADPAQGRQEGSWVTSSPRASSCNIPRT